MGKFVRTEAESDDSSDDDQQNKEFSYNQQIFFTDGGRIIKVNFQTVLNQSFTIEGKQQEGRKDECRQEETEADWWIEEYWSVKGQWKRF